MVDNCLIMRRLGQQFFAVLLTTLCLGYLVLKLDFGSVGPALLSLPTKSILFVCGTLLVGALLASLRLKLVASSVGFDLTWGDSLKAMAVGQIAGALTFQFFGQIAGRSAILRRTGVSLPANVAMAAYERIIAVSVSVGLAIIGAVILFGQVTLDLHHGGAELVYILSGEFAVAVATGIFGWGIVAAAIIRSHITQRSVIAVARVFAVTLLVQTCTAIGYCLVATALAPVASIWSLAAASTIIMFAASLPISFGGWGVREMSAVFVLKTLGIPATDAVAVALLVGIISLLVVMLIAAASSLFAGHGPIAEGKLTQSDSNANILRALCWVMPLSVATLIVFQIHVPGNVTDLNVNAADPIALLSAMVFVGLAVTKQVPLSRIPLLSINFVCAAIIVGIALLIGWAGLVSQNSPLSIEDLDSRFS